MHAIQSHLRTKDYTLTRRFLSTLKIENWEDTTAHTQYDLIIIGGGSAGLPAAQIAHSLGAKVLLVDKERLGGDCLLHGCVPSKSLLHVARIVQQTKEVARLGLTPVSLAIDMAKVSEHIQNVISRVGETEKAYVEGVTVTFGEASFKSPTTLHINGEDITGRNTLIATGSHPIVPAIPGLQEAGYLTNEDAFNLTDLPKSLIVVGGGPIGVELGQALARLGTQVTIIQGPGRILPKEDPEASDTLHKVLSAEGIHILLQTRMTAVMRKGDKKVVLAKQGEQEITLESDEILLALGRRPNVADLNLEAANVKYSEKGIDVDEYLQTSTPNILAAGDVIGGYLFTHVAAYHAGIAVRNALLPIAKKKVDYRVVPWCTFTDPEVARVGLTPAQAEEQHKQVRIITLPWSDIDRAQAEDETAGFIKLVLAGKKEEIVGAHLVGAHAGEILGEITLAMQQHLTVSNIYNTIHIYPTLSTGIQQTAFQAYLTGSQVIGNRKVVQTISGFRG